MRTERKFADQLSKLMRVTTRWIGNPFVRIGGRGIDPIAECSDFGRTIAREVDHAMNEVREVRLSESQHAPTPNAVT